MNTNNTTPALADLEKRLREHDDPRLYREADELTSEAADAIAALARRAAQPAEGAGQAGQVAHIATVVKGNLCNRLERVSDEAMDTPVGTKLFAERAAAPADKMSSKNTAHPVDKFYENRWRNV